MFIEMVSSRIELKITSFIPPLICFLCVCFSPPSTHARIFFQNPICVVLRPKRSSQFQFHIGKWLKFNIYWRRSSEQIISWCGLKGVQLPWHVDFTGKLKSSPTWERNSRKSWTLVSLPVNWIPRGGFGVASNFAFLPFYGKYFPMWKTFH